MIINRQLASHSYVTTILFILLILSKNRGSVPDAGPVVGKNSNTGNFR